MQNLIRFTLILLVVIAAVLLTLAVAGVLSSTELKDNMLLVGKITAIVFAASAIILLVSKK